MEGRMGVSRGKDGTGGDTGGGAEARNPGGTGNSHRRGTAGADGGVGLSAVSPHDALLLVLGGKWTADLEGTRGSTMADSGATGQR